MDNNNNQGFPENTNQEPELQNGVNPNQSNNSEAGNTYWEAGNAQELPAQDTQINGNNFPGQQVPAEPLKKKSKMPLAAAIVILILAIAGTAFAFQDKIKNALSLGIKDPAEYYASVEQEAIDKAVDKMLAQVDGYDFSKNMAVEMTMDLSYDKATVSSLLQGTAGMTIEDLESYIGIPLDEIGMDMTVALEDSKIYEEIGLSLNQVDLITFELFMDSLEKQLLMRLPELSPAYMSQSLDMSEYGVEEFDFGSYTKQAELIYSDKTAEFLKRYATIITSQMKNVELEKNVELKVDQISMKANKLTVTIDAKTLLDIAAEILKEAKDDEYILELLPLFNVTKEQYLGYIAQAESALNVYETPTAEGNEIVMDVYVDGDGNIVGREIDVFTENVSEGSLGYYFVSKGTEDEYEFYINDANGTEMIGVTGSQKEDNGAFDGTATLDLNAEALELPSALSFTITYEDARSEIKDNMQYTYGKYSISSLAMMGMGIGMEFDVVDGVQKMTFSLDMGSTPIVSLDITSKYLKNFDMPTPSETEQVFDALTESESWLATMDIEKYVADLSDKLGIDVQSIVDSFFPVY